MFIQSTCLDDVSKKFGKIDRLDLGMGIKLKKTSRYAFVLDVIDEMVEFNEYYKQKHNYEPMCYPDEMERAEWEAELMQWWLQKRKSND